MRKDNRFWGSFLFCSSEPLSLTSSGNGAQPKTTVQTMNKINVSDHSALATINTALDSIKNCEDVETIKNKLYLLVNYLINTDIVYPTVQQEDMNKNYRAIVTELYTKLYNNDPVMILFIAQLYIRRIKGYIPLSNNNNTVPILTEKFVGPISLQTLVSTAETMEREISNCHITETLKLDTETLFQMGDYWLSFNFNKYGIEEMLDLENNVFWEIVALLDCDSLIDKFQKSNLTCLERFLLSKLIQTSIKNTNIISIEFNKKLIKCYGDLSQNEFLLHYSKKIEIDSSTGTVESQLIFNMIPIMELLDHPEEDFIDNVQFLNFLANGLSSLNSFLNHSDPLNILKIHEVLSSEFMKSKYTLLSVLEIAKISLILYMIELLDNIHFAKFSRLLPLSFYKDFLPNLPTITKHSIWETTNMPKTFDSLSSKFSTLNLCLCLLQNLITSCWNCYNSLQVSIPMDFHFHKLLAVSKFSELFYFKQLSYTLSEKNDDSLGCYEFLFVDSYRRLVFENCLENQLSIFKNWQVFIEEEDRSTEAFSAFVHYFLIQILNEHQDLKLITESLVSQVFFKKLSERDTEFNSFLKTDIFSSNFFQESTNQQEKKSFKNIKTSELLRSLAKEESDLGKLEELLKEMKNNNDVLVQTSQRLSLKPTCTHIYSTPEKVDDRTSPNQNNIDLSFKDLRLETNNLSFSNISPKSAIIHNLASSSQQNDKSQQFTRKMSTHIDSFI